MANTFFARFLRRMPAVVPQTQGELYSPVPEGDALLGTGADQLRAYLVLHPNRAVALEESCRPLRERLRAVDEGDAADDEVAAMFPHGYLAARRNDLTIWDAVFNDLRDATEGGAGITLNPLVLLMTMATARSVSGTGDEGLLFVSAEAREVADRLLAELPALADVVSELMSISRSTIAARATQAGIESVLMHRRFRMTESLDVVMMLEPDGALSADAASRVIEDVDYAALSVWSSDIDAARNWSPAADPGSTSVVILSVRVPVSSIWLAPRKESREFLISAEAIEPEHLDVVNRD